MAVLDGRGPANNPATPNSGGFQLLDLIITKLKSHMASHWLK